MNRIVCVRSILAGICLAILACTASWGKAQTARSEEAQVCSMDEPRDITNEYKWRWHAHQNLSCLISKLEQALKGPATSDQVTLSRKEVELLLQLAWAGRDSAQRIGR
jgi:hypothetical protein